MKLNWHRDGDQHVAIVRQAEYRITEWVTGSGSMFALAVKQFSIGKITDGGRYLTLKRAKEVAYSLDIR